MICPRCAEAADKRAPSNEHCASAGGPGSPCDCQHYVRRSHTSGETS